MPLYKEDSREKRKETKNDASPFASPARGDDRVLFLFSFGNATISGTVSRLARRKGSKALRNKQKAGCVIPKLLESRRRVEASARKRQAREENQSARGRLTSLSHSLIRPSQHTGSTPSARSSTLRGARPGKNWTGVGRRGANEGRERDDVGAFFLFGYGFSLLCSSSFVFLPLPRAQRFPQLLFSSASTFNVKQTT
jgi:hypothetical protein